jgi:hypothetical protein
MSNNPSPPFVGVRILENRTPTGRRTGTPANRAALYFAFGRDKAAELEGRQRGEWLGSDGRVQTHEAVMAWARQEALRHRYTFEALLSVPQGDLSPKAFCQAMQQGGQIADWRLIAHQDTDYRHAHVLFFRDRRIEKQAFLSWQTAVRTELAGLEQQQLADRAARQEAALERGQERSKGLDLNGSTQVSGLTQVSGSTQVRLSKGWEVGFG